MEVTIQNVTINNKIANKLRAKVIFYDLNGSCETYWEIFNDTDGRLLDGNCRITQETLDVWTNSNLCLLEDIAQQNGFVIIE